jgi:hypothetical protein
MSEDQEKSEENPVEKQKNIDAANDVTEDISDDVTEEVANDVTEEVTDDVTKEVTDDVTEEVIDDEKKSSAALPSEEPVEIPVMEKTEEKRQPVARSYTEWQAVGEAVVGMAHRRNTPPVVCQDAYCLSNTKRVVIAVCDGAGSSILSEVGSSRLSQSIVRLVCSLENVICDLLDTDNNPKFGNKLAQILYNYSISLLQDIASDNKRDIKDFRTTLLLVITGIKNIFWFKVGDGEIVIEKGGILECIGESKKGEFSNETVFIDKNLKVEDVQYGLLNIESICGIAVMSDGASERLVSLDRKKIADRLQKYFYLLKDSKLPREELYKFLTNYEVWKGSTHDDKTIVLAARKEIS